MRGACVVHRMRLSLPDAHAPHSHAPHSHAPHTRQNAVKKAAKDAEAAERKTEKEAQACRQGCQA
jgi:hypothetical protein